MALVERDVALASLLEYASQARAGDGRLVLVPGEAGIGKSSLVEALAERLAEARWSWGLCDGLFTPRPLGPLFDIAAELGGELLKLSRARAPREELFDALLREVSGPGRVAYPPRPGTRCSRGRRVSRRRRGGCWILAGMRALAGDDDAGMAFHAEGARDADAVLHYAVRAGRRAAELASHREAAAQYERALRFAAALPAASRAELYDRLGDELSLVDRGDDLVTAAEKARDLWRTAGDRVREGDALRRLSVAMVSLCRGAEGAAAAEEAVAVLEPLGDSRELARAYAQLANQRSLANRLADAVRLASRASEVELALAAAAGEGNAWLRGSVAVWLLRTESPLSLAGPVAEPYQLLLDGSPTESADAWLAIGSGYEAGLSLLSAGDESPLRRALGIFDDLGARPAARLARQRLRSLGVRSIPAGPRGATRAHPVGLTRREHEVLDLIVAGRTNAEIAVQLVIAVKTVDHHVSAVLAKLGAANRSAAAKQARQLGLVPHIDG